MNEKTNQRIARISKSMQRGGRLSLQDRVYVLLLGDQLEDAQRSLRAILRADRMARRRANNLPIRPTAQSRPLR